MRSIRYSTIFGSNPILAAMDLFVIFHCFLQVGSSARRSVIDVAEFRSAFLPDDPRCLGRPLGAHRCLYLPVMFSTLDLISRHTRVLLFGSTSRFLPSLRTWSTPSRSAYIFPYLRERCYDAPCCGLSLRFTDLKRQMSFIGTRMWQQHLWASIAPPPLPAWLLAA